MYYSTSFNIYRLLNTANCGVELDFFYESEPLIFFVTLRLFHFS